MVSAPKDTRHERVYILVKNPNDVELLTNIKRICDKNGGFNEVVLVLQEKGEKKALKMPFRVEVGEEFMKEMKATVGEDSVKVK